MSRESTLEDSYYLDPVTGQPVLKPANKPPDYLHSPVLHADSGNVPSIYSPSSPHPTSTVKTTGSLVNATVRSPRRQQPQVPRRRSLERQVRLEEEDKFDGNTNKFDGGRIDNKYDKFESIAQQQQHLAADYKPNEHLIDDQGNRKDSYESYTTSLGDEEDRELEMFEDSQSAWYPKDPQQQNWNNQQQQQQNNNGQWMTNQQQKQPKTAGRTLPLQPNKPNYFEQQPPGMQPGLQPGLQLQQQGLQQAIYSPGQTRSIYDQPFGKENEQPPQAFMGPNEMQQLNQQQQLNNQLNTNQLNNNQHLNQQQLNQQQQLAPGQTQAQPLSPAKPTTTTDLLTDPQYLDLDQQQRQLDQSTNKKEQWRQNKNETTFWQTVSEDETYDLYMEQHLQQQKQKQAFGVISQPFEPVKEESYYESPTTNKPADQSLDFGQPAQQQQQPTIQQTERKPNETENQYDQFDKREQWKSLPDQQSSIWQTAESEDTAYDSQFDTMDKMPGQTGDSSLAMLGGLSTKPLDVFENEPPIAYDEQAENEKLFDQFDVNKQKQAVGPPSALKSQSLIGGFSEPKTVTFSDQIQEESYDVISEGESTKGQKPVRTDPYTGQPIIDSELNYLSDEGQDDTLNKLASAGSSELGDQQTDYQTNEYQPNDYLGFDQPPAPKRSSLIESTLDQQLIGVDRADVQLSGDQHLSEQQSGLIEYAPTNTEGMTPGRVRWMSAFNKIVAEMQEVGAAFFA